MQHDRHRLSLYVLVSVVALFILGRIVGGTLFANGWSFTHWNSTTLSHDIIWFVAFAILFIVLYRLHTVQALFLSKRWLVLSLVFILSLAIAFLRFDSFLYGAGNLRVAQLAQDGRIILRWFEFGSVGLAALLYKLYHALGLPNNTSGVFAWRSLSFLCAAASLWGAIKLATELTADTAARYVAFALIFFGGQTMLLFGFVGVEPTVVAVTIWFALYLIRLLRNRRQIDLGLLWGITVAGVILHFSMIFLVPAAVYGSAFYLRSKSRAASLALTGAVASTLILLIFVYYFAYQSLEFSSKLLFLDGKSPSTDYGLFSPRHLGDFLQVLFLVAPLFFVALVQQFTGKVHDTDRNVIYAVWWMVIGGLIALFILDPAQGIVLDLPRFAAYLAPVAILIALQSVYIDTATSRHRIHISLTAAFAVMVPLSYLPVYTRIHQSEAYVSNYCDEHDNFYRTTCLAYRDAYFYRGEFSDADHWEWNLPVKSPDILNLNGTVALSANNQDNEALGVLKQIVVKNPYWAEPRATIAKIQMKLGRYNLAKPQIDTCLMLEPYGRESHVNLYAYYRDIQDYGNALSAAREAVYLFPQDRDIATDLMIINYRAGRLEEADSMAKELLEKNSSLAFPYLVKGFIAERNGDLPNAIRLYHKFILLAPKEPETPAIAEHLEKLQAGK